MRDRSEGRKEAKGPKYIHLSFLYFSATDNVRFEAMGAGHWGQEPPRGTAEDSVLPWPTCLLQEGPAFLNKDKTWPNL